MVHIGLSCTLDYWLIYDALSLGLCAPFDKHGNLHVSKSPPLSDWQSMHYDPTYIDHDHLRQMTKHNLPLNFKYVKSLEHPRHHGWLDTVFRHWMRRTLDTADQRYRNDIDKSLSTVFWKGFLRSYADYVVWKIRAQRDPAIAKWFSPEARRKQAIDHIDSVLGLGALQDDWESIWKIFDENSTYEFIWKILSQQGWCPVLNDNMLTIDVLPERLVGLKGSTFDTITMLLHAQTDPMRSGEQRQASVALTNYDLSNKRTDQRFALVEPVIRYLRWWTIEARRLAQLESKNKFNVSNRPHWYVKREGSASWVNTVLQKIRGETVDMQNHFPSDPTSMGPSIRLIRQMRYYRALMMPGPVMGVALQRLESTPPLMIGNFLTWQTFEDTQT